MCNTTHIITDTMTARDVWMLEFKVHICNCIREAASASASTLPETVIMLQISNGAPLTNVACAIKLQI